MTYLVAAVVLVGAIGLLNLILGLGIIRRLREHSELLARGSGTSGADTGVLAVGETATEFSIRTVEGATITRDDLSRDTVVAFFSPHCQPCKDILAEFVDYARVHGGPGRVFAVVSGDRSETTEMVGALAAVATVVTDEEAKPVVGAFKTTGFPAIYLMGEDGVIAASGHGMSVLPRLVAA